eukprot:TRINITY_DN26140_c0_g1_i2.p1 TRINITY_DN26140_c0_g1~~TRINITY_DN26140_c0_g1_i2.p1  ORF type:complete len:418 (+),score=70.16 TRINITY_DN26140_c0_g1_i2:76-1254(+)
MPASRNSHTARGGRFGAERLLLRGGALSASELEVQAAGVAKGAPELQLFYTKPDGETGYVEIPADATVGDLAQAIAQSMDISRPPALRYCGEPLRDRDAALADLGVCSEATVTVDRPARGHRIFALGESHGAVVTADRRCALWGGNGLSEPITSDMQEYEGAVCSVACTDYDSIALADDGRAVLILDACEDHCVALTTDGRLMGWGFHMEKNDGLLLHQPPELPAGSSVVAVGAMSGVGCALLQDGSFLHWPVTSGVSEEDWPECVPGVVSMSCGWRHVLFILEDGSIKGCGADDYDKTKPPEAGGRKAVLVAAGYDHSIAAYDDGSIECWGEDSDGCCQTPDLGGRRAVALAAGNLFSGAVLDDGSLIGWGCNDDQEASPPQQVKAALDLL